ncbi:PAS domain S-box protein [Maridesulfovibrio frigidus]|uniref:PAS domain S-box protein n=1 Tax=Maridesulfovibrio frigidus TaxID=340956 RepID=UPI00068E996E|nr:PAS domain S-box protein [Maridesulfovibrio frigidus]
MNHDKAYILILDDDPTNLHLLKAMLEMESNLVAICATTGEEALQLFEEHEYALAILDMLLPGIDGLEVLRRMRESEILRKIPVLFVTAVYKDSDSIAEGYKLGAADYIFKPVNINILISKVRLFVNLYFNRKALEESEQLLKKRSIEADESRKYFRSLFEYMPSGLVVYESFNQGSDFIIKDMNPTAEALANVTFEDVRGKLVSEVFPSILETDLMDVFYRVWKTGENEVLPHIRYIGSNGERFYENNVYRQPNGELVAIFNDVTERIKVKQRIQRSEAILALTQHLSKVGGWELELDTMKLYWTYETYRIHEVERDFIPNLDNALDFYKPQHQSIIAEAVKRCIEEGEPFDLELEIVTAKGRKLWVRALGEPVYTNSRIVKIGGAFQDISEQRARIEQEEQAREKYQLLYGSIRDAIIIADMDRLVVDMNPAFSDLFGYSLDDIKGQKTLVVYENESEFERMGDFIRRDGKSGKSIVFTMRFRKKSGEVFSGDTAIFAVRDANGSVTGFMGLIRDITERKELERQLAYAHKLESIGLLAAGVAHEINTPIMYVSGNMKFLKDSFGSIVQLLEKQKELYESVKNNQNATSLLPDIEKAIESSQYDYMLEEIPQAISDSQEGVDRISHIVQAMKKFSHPGMEAITLVDVKDAIENTITIASNEWKYDSTVVTDFPKDIPMIECVPGDFNQAILNVLVNAAHANSAMAKKNGGKGTISISVATDRDSLKICISDTGKGISLEDENKIFDPFFTTKEVGKGTGQGLSITHTIVKKHGGTITFNSIENKGTTFCLRFPIKQKA